MTTWILIIFMYKGGATMAEFSSKERCEIARESIRKQESDYNTGCFQK